MKNILKELQTTMDAKTTSSIMHRVKSLLATVLLVLLLVIGSALAGGALMVLADLLARVVALPAEVPVGLVTSAIGAPFFLWLITRVKP